MLRTRYRPEMEELYALKSDYASYHGRRLSQHKEDEVFYRLKYPVPSPDGRSALYSPAGYQIVQDLTNHVAAEFPTFNVLKRNMDEKEINRSEKLTAWLNGYWHATNLTLLLRKMLFFDAVRGCHVLKILYDPGQWPAKPEPPITPMEPENLLDDPEVLIDYALELAMYKEEKDEYDEDKAEYDNYIEEHLPILPQLIDPQFCMWEPGDDPKRIIVAWDRTVDEVMKAHPQTIEYLGDARVGSKITWCEYFDEFDSAYWIEGSGGANSRGSAPFVVKDLGPHNLGFFPFIIDGPWVSPLPDPEDHYPSIYFAIKNMLQYESTLLTQIAHMIRINGWAPIVIKSDRPDGQQPILDMTPGKANYFQADEDVRYLEFSGQTMAVLERLIDSVGQYTEKGSGLGDILKGAPKGKSGYQQAQLAAMARVALVPIEHSTQRTLDQASRLILKLIRVLGEKITILGQYGGNNDEATIGPQDVKKFGRIEIKLKTVLPIDEGAKIANLTNMVKAGWLSRTTAARLAGVENPEDEHARWVAEEISQLPEVKQAQAMQYLAEHWPELYTILQGLQNQQQGGGQGGPTQPQVGPGGPGGAGGGANLSRPGQRPEAAPGSSREMNQVIRQMGTGGMPQQRLPMPQENQG
jgi:hypothetical protein